MGVYSSYYILLVLSKKGDTPRVLIAPLKKQQHARQKGAKRPHAIHHDSRRVRCTDAKGRDMHNEADALRPPCSREDRGKQIVLSQGNRGIKVSYS